MRGIKKELRRLYKIALLFISSFINDALSTASVILYSVERK
jgi:hypothetical protein